MSEVFPTKEDPSMMSLERRVCRGASSEEDMGGERLEQLR